MTDTFNAIVAEDFGGRARASLKQITLADLPDEEVLVAVAYSTLNYKDGLAISGKGKICRTLPLICGIDLAGEVVESRASDFQPGDRVLVNGYGLSETYPGGYTQKQRLKPEWLVRIPDAFSAEQAMAIGTAGYTAMLSVMAIQDHGVQPEDGPVLVTGAGGGVGSIAIMLLAKLGYQVTAVSGRIATGGDYLRSLGASELLDRSQLDRDSKPLEQETWAAAVDSVGDRTLATVLAQTRHEGIVTACGLAGGMGLPTSVAPFILRGVTLRGINSVMAAMERRQWAWDALAALIDTRQLATIYRVEPLTKLPELADRIIAGDILGRVVIDVNA